MSGAASWGREVEPVVARERILDAAGAVVARRGDLDLTVAEVAAEAGCARGTVYRYAGGRDDLRRAFIEREARRVGARVAGRVGTSTEPGDRLVEGVLAALDEVRRDPVLSAWFTEGAAATTGRLALGAAALTELVTAFVDGVIAAAAEQGRLRDGAAAEVPVVVDAVIRLTLSLLALPGPPASERRLVEVALVPLVVA